MLTDRPGIVTARPPRRITRKPKASWTSPAAPVIQPRTREFADPAKAADAADRLWRELVRRATGG